MKSIVFFIQNFSRAGGSEKVTAEYANALAENGFRVTILSICGNNTSYFPINNKIKMFTLIPREKVDNKKNFFSVLLKLISFYHNNKFDIVFDIFASLSIYSIFLKKIYKFQNVTWEHYRYDVSIGMNNIGRKLAVRFSDKIITLTESDKKAYYENNKYMRRKIYVVKNGVDLNLFRIDYETRNFYRKKFGYSDKDKVIGHVGRFSPEKNHKFIIDLFACLKKDCDDYKLLLIGDGELKKETEEYAKQKGVFDDVTFTGNVSNVQDYMQLMDLFILPSKFEGLGIVAIEAQACGLPVLASTGVPDDIRITENVRFASTENMDDWTKAVAEMIVLPKQDNSQAVRNAGYDINQTAEEIKRMYLESIYDT